MPEGCHWRDLRKVHENVGVALQNILDRIQQANPDTLAGIFGDVAWGNKDKLPEHALLNLIEAFHSLDLRPSTVGHDVLGQRLRVPAEQFADESGKKAGEFFTPRSVVRLLTRILDPQPTDTVYDPACGSGGMLVEAANEVARGGRLAAPDALLRAGGQPDHRRHRPDEPVPARHRGRASSCRGDTLRDPKFLDERGRLQQFDVVIANPPFSLKNWGAESGPRPVGPRSLRGAARQQRRLRLGPAHGRLDDADDGRVGVVMPHGVLFRGGAERRHPECLLEGDRLEAVVGLPPNLFYSHAIPACLLIFRATSRRAPRARAVRRRVEAVREGPQPEHDGAEDVEASSTAYQQVTTPTAKAGPRSGSCRSQRSRPTAGT